jgi:radical SAM superfamily enzyme YgiQ (UPF0313 family)
LIRCTVSNVLMVYPAFSPHSFWNYQATCEVVGARYSAAPLGLITVAALLPSDWNVHLVNRNTEELTDEDLEWADMVMTGGMLPQQLDVKRIIGLAHDRGIPVVLGGPDVTSSPDVYPEADFKVLGEAEEIMSEFVAAWEAGKTSGTFTAKEFPDLTNSPLPRFDLLKLGQYMHVGVQLSRGCPFSCEFCNVIELNGRTPRLKTTEQMLRELDALYDRGYRGHVDFVDDNLIGNRKAVKPFLADLARWSERHGHPFEFSTEASINIADDDELLTLMERADFFAIFVGIETPDSSTLLQTNKGQNTRRDLVSSVHKIYQHGMFVNAGFIIGFDAEKDSVAAGMIEFIEAAAIPVCMVGLLYALPNTALSKRLLSEGRLHAESDRHTSDDFADQCSGGLNYRTLRPRDETLTDYRAVLAAIYEPGAFFRRVRSLVRKLDLSKHRTRRPAASLPRDLRSAARIQWKSGFALAGVRMAYWRALVDCLLTNPRALRTVVSMAALYLHLRPFAERMDGRLAGQIRDLAKPRLEPARIDAPQPVGMI